MISFPIELVGERLLSEGAVFFTEALAKLNAREFIREAADASPCCAQCAGCKLDLQAPLRDAKRMLEVKRASPVSIVAYSMGRELAEGVACRAVLIDGVRLAYQRENGDVADPLSKFIPANEDPDHGKDQRCCCGQPDHAAEHLHTNRPTRGSGAQPEAGTSPDPQ
ncbi:hypothetical protein [Pseudenhygromyxa sp. WMMC2535]|uniref:hypothetical protein n=1 Tax=Pseudenhygromyxa sp. WMMC2535 TaxID=2712867 RepID=UPI0020D11DF4|nr:hypothetical protein [Pseudenhygromyxa sp. WMMC2535]